MALFKIETGLAANLITNRPKSVEGYCYFTPDDGKFYIDVATGDALTPVQNGGKLEGATRIPINSYLSDWAVRAYADENGKNIASSYGTSLSISGYTLKILNSKGALLNSITLPKSVDSATKLTSSAGSLTQPIYFKDGKPIACTYALNKTVPSDAVFTDTHWTTGIKVGASGTNANSALSNPFIKVLDNSTYRSQIQLKGSGSTTVSSDANGIITIAGATALKNPAALTLGGKTYDGSSAITVTAADLGLSSALRFVGTTSTALVDGSTTKPITIGSNTSYNPVIGDVVINSNNNAEYVWVGAKWELLGDESSYKVKQTAVSSPSANGSATAFIDTISQDANGKITVTKKNLNTSGTWSGNAATATKATQDSAGQQINTTYIKELSISGRTITYKKGNNTTGTLTTQDTTYNDVRGATAGAAGQRGLVPAPAAGAQNKFLRGDGTWAVASSVGEIVSFSKNLQVTESWMDTGITGTDLTTGSYIIQATINNSTGNSLYTEMWTGVCSWYSGNTNSSNSDEILLHNAGHADNNNEIYLRTLRAGDPGRLKLQIAAKIAFTEVTEIRFKFRRLI